MTTVRAADAPIRDLDEEDFVRRYRCDRFTATVLGNRLAYVVEHMCSRLLTTAFSPILRDFYDFAATITGTPDAGYPTPAMSNSILLFTGTMTESVRVAISEYGPDRLEPGDVIVSNDPYRGGTHVNDMLFSRPVFHDGKLVGLVNMKAHQLDMGGVVPGGFTLTKSNVYEDGIVLSPRLLYRRGEPVPETWSLIFDNVRFGEILFPDIESICAELDLGERLLVETVDRYGAEAVHGAIDYVCDASAERIRFALETVPDGEWEGEELIDCDALDETEEYLVRVRVIKRGGRAEVDFSGSSRQARTCINTSPLDAKTTVGVAFKNLFDPRGRFTSGTMRCVDLVVPPGAGMYALPPNGAVFAYWEQSQAMISAVLRALAQAVGPLAMAGDRGSADIHNANGLHPDGTPWVSAAQVGGEVGPFGGNRHGDADSNMLSYQANGLGTAVEAIESGAPVVVVRHEIVPDAAGPGTYRGGTSLMRDSLWLLPAEHHLMSIRYKRASGFGVHGGGEGKTGGIWIWEPSEDGAARYPSADTTSYRDATPIAGMLDPETNEPSRDGAYLYPYRQPSWHTPAMAVLRYVNNGGGGWGDPFARDPEVVLRDVRDGYVSIEGASRDYGVVVAGDPDTDPEGLRVDTEQTAALRGAR